MDSADAVSRRVLYCYYYYCLVAVSVGTAANRMGILAQGCARHAGSPETMLCNPGAVQRAAAWPEYVQYCPDKPKTDRSTALDFRTGNMRVESPKNVFVGEVSWNGALTVSVSTSRIGRRTGGKPDTPVFSRPLKTRYADPLECRTQGRAGQGGRSNAHQSAGSNGDGSDGAEWIEQCIKCIVLVPALLDLAFSQPRKTANAQPGFVVGGDISTWR